MAGTFGTGTKDVDWLPNVGAVGWVLITKDKNIRRRPLELQALTQSGVRAFVMTGDGMTGEQQAEVISKALGAMIRLLARQAAPFIARISRDGNVALIDPTGQQ